MKKQQDFKRRRGLHWLIMLLLAVFITAGGISGTAMAAVNSIFIDVDGDGNPEAAEISSATLTPTGALAGVTSLNVTGSTVLGDATTDTTTIWGNTTIHGQLNMSTYSITNVNDLQLLGDETIAGTLGVSGNLTATGTTNNIGTYGVSYNNLYAEENFLDADYSNTLSAEYNNLYAYENYLSAAYNYIEGTTEISSPDYYDDGGTRVRVTDGSFSVHSYSDNGSLYPETTFQIGPAGMRMMSDNDDGGVMRLIMNSNSGNGSMGYAYGDRYTGLYFDDGDITVGAEDSYYGIYSGINATTSGMRAGYQNNDLGVMSGLYADGNSTSISYFDWDSGSPYTYGLYADNSVVTVGYRDYGTGVDHGLAVYSDHTLLTGGTNSSSLLLQDGAATLAVGTDTLPEETVLTATNSGAATDVTISSDTFTVSGATSLNGGASVTGGLTTDTLTTTGLATLSGGLDVTGNLTMNGWNIDTEGGDVRNINILDVNGNTTLGDDPADTTTVTGTFSATGNSSLRSTSGLLGLDVNDSVAQLGYRSGTLSNGVLATSGGVILSSTDTTAHSSTVMLDGSQAYISYNNGVAESGLEAGPAGLIVGSTNGTTSLGMSTDIANNEVIVGYIDNSAMTAYGLHADNDEVNVGYNTLTGFHGLTVDADSTTLSGGTNSSVWTLADGQADLSVDGTQVMVATNNGSTTDVTISSDTFTVTGTTTTNGIVNTGDISTGTLHTAGVIYAGGNLNMGNNDINNVRDINHVRDLSVDGNTTLGNAAADSTTVAGTFTVDTNGTGTPGGNTFTVGASGIQANVIDASSNNAVFGLGSLPTSPVDFSGYGPGSYIGYQNTAAGTVYGLFANDSSVNVGYINSTGYEGLQVTNGQTTLTGGTSSSELTLADGSTTLSVDSTELLAATNSGSATNVTIGNTANSYISVSSAAGGTYGETIALNGDTAVYGDLTVTGNLTVNGTTFSGDNISTDGDLDVDGATTLNSTLDVDGATTLNSTLDVTGATTLNSTLDVTGATTLNSTLDVTGATTLNSTLDVTGATTLNSTLTVADHVELESTLDVDGAVDLDSTLNVEGATTLNSTLDVYGATNIHNTLDVNTAGGSVLSVHDAQIIAQTEDGSGLIINNGGNVTLLNSTNHGLTISPTETVLSGGTTSTTLTLNNSGATFRNTLTGGPARVTGVADGINDFDAVNVRQLQKFNIGVASVSALAAIPATMPGKRFAIGAGYGYFESESAVALGLKANLWDFLSVQAGIGFGVGQSESTYSANAGFSFSF